jgi:hypothetical protein
MLFIEHGKEKYRRSKRGQYVDERVIQFMKETKIISICDLLNTGKKNIEGQNEANTRMKEWFSS